MKKILLFCIMTIATIFSFTSCNSVEDGFQGTYQFWEPCTQWGATMKEVKTFMSKQSGWKMNFEVKDKEIYYTHKKTGMQVVYEVGSAGLHKANLSYINCNHEYEHMKSDWAEKYNLTWEKSTFSDWADITELNSKAETSYSSINQDSYIHIILTPLKAE